jgi:diguanylate cyclase (GGDEF)-like protein/PAS domain S-box-containing protein
LRAVGQEVNHQHLPLALFRDLVESAPEGLVLVDPAGAIVLVNAEAERLFGYARDELLGQPLDLLVPARFRGAHHGHVSAYSADPHPRLTSFSLDLVGLRKDGSEFPAEILLSPLGPERGGLTLSSVRDISDRKRVESGLLHFTDLVRSSDDAIISKSLDGTVVSWNAAAERLYGYAAEEILGKPISVLVPPGHDDDLVDILERVRAGEGVVNFETVRARKDGTYVDVSLTVSPVRDEHGNIIGASTIARDVSELVRHREQLRYLADHDALTGTLNRRRFEQDISEQLGRARRYGERAVLMVIDIDDFKQINDSYGHRTGDRALKSVAAALRHRLRGTDTIARLGGDEFGVLLPYAGAEQAAAVAADLRRVVAELNLGIDGQHDAHVSISVGFTVLDQVTASDEDVLAAADRAMYREKPSSRTAEGAVAGADAGSTLAGPRLA